MKIVFTIELICVLGLLSFMIGRSVIVQESQTTQKLQITQETQSLQTAQGTQKLQKFQIQEEEINQNTQTNQNRQIMEVGQKNVTGRGREQQALSDSKGTVSDNDIVAGKPQSIDEIILVNKDNKLPEDYEVELKILPDGVNRAAKEAYEPLCEMLQEGRKEGLYFEICSSYRDVKRQTELFEEDVAVLVRRGYSYEEAYAEVAKETMPPGCSEHSTGLAFDIVALGYQMLDAGQEKTAENKWLQEHCAEYGFILRYPKGKEDITAISYESWHFRYVGKEVAEYIMDNGITLEEYLEN